MSGCPYSEYCELSYLGLVWFTVKVIFCHDKSKRVPESIRLLSPCKCISPQRSLWFRSVGSLRKSCHFLGKLRFSVLSSSPNERGARKTQSEGSPLLPRSRANRKHRQTAHTEQTALTIITTITIQPLPPHPQQHPLRKEQHHQTNNPKRKRTRSARERRTSPRSPSPRLLPRRTAPRAWMWIPPLRRRK